MSFNLTNAEIVLINPPGTFIKDAKLVIHHGIPPIGLAYIAGAFKKAGLNYKLVDCLGEDINRFRKLPENEKVLIRGLTFEQIITRMPSAPKYFCIGTNYSSDWYFTTQFIKRLKKVYPKSVVILGGENPTAYWDKILKYENDVDFCIIGEGDETIINLLSALKDETCDISSIKGIAFRNKNAEVVKNERPGRLKNLEDFFPDWEQFPVENYLKNKMAVRNYGRRTMPMIASRGCPYQCTFCNSKNKWGTLQVVRNPDEIIAEMRFLKERYKIEHICLVDLASTANGKWFIEFCKKMIDSGLNLTWEMSSGTRSELLSYENLKLVKKAKNIHLSLSPESGSKRILKLIQKELDPDHIEKVVGNCAKVGIRSKANFVVGLQSQTISEINETYLAALRFAWRGADDIAIYSYVPFPGTEMHNRLIASGVIKIDTREEYEAYNMQLSTYSFVAVNKSHVQKKYPIHILNGLVMLACFFISMIRKPYRIPQFFWNVSTRNAIGVFEIAAYNSIMWPFFLLKTKIKDFKENTEKKPILKKLIPIKQAT